MSLAFKLDWGFGVGGSRRACSCAGRWQRGLPSLRTNWTAVGPWSW